MPTYHCEGLHWESVLFNPDFSKKLMLQTDASDVGLAAVLFQEVNGEEHLVLYLSSVAPPVQ